jgi:hypothetical protein
MLKTFRKALSILLGLLVIDLLGALFVLTQTRIYPRYPETIGYISRADVIFLVIKLSYVCLSCAVGGMLTAFVGRSRTANIIVGILMTALVVISGFRVKTFYPMSFWMTLIILITPFVVLGYEFVSSRNVSS